MKKNEKTFEEKMAELEELIGKLESGTVPLEVKDGAYEPIKEEDILQ